jgi:hypothetical protein
VGRDPVDRGEAGLMLGSGIWVAIVVFRWARRSATGDQRRARTGGGSAGR